MRVSLLQLVRKEFEAGRGRGGERKGSGAVCGGETSNLSSSVGNTSSPLP